jgi:hypothetical protein
MSPRNAMVNELIAERERLMGVIAEGKTARVQITLLNKLIALNGDVASQIETIAPDGTRPKSNGSTPKRKERMYPPVKPVRGMYHCPEKGCTEKYKRPQELSLHRFHKHKEK